MIDEQLDEKAIFNVARKIESPEARTEYMQQACGADDCLRARVEILLRAFEAQASFLEGPPVNGECPPNGHPVTEHVGDTIGRYRIVEQIGEGGFGVVFRAVQTEPLHRHVALKIIKPGMDTREVIARFEAERQALAMMDHPNIAKVFDAGATKTGRPYFVMEFVQGVPITEYCDQCNLAMFERLELFITVCQAVQHAHQKGVIHRDLKPSNVLVAMQDGAPTPKIIDFGVAKAIDQRLTDRTLVTAFAQMVGTPLYMSPEQAELSRLGVDTRSDIYSLGVLLYELLTGTTPFNIERLRSASYDELRRIIREEEPPRPSARLSSLSLGRKGGVSGENFITTAETLEAKPVDLSTIAERRHTDTRRLCQSIRGELDWIVMKCLEKDRTRRYESASDLAQDVKRFLADEPVEAGPPSVVYRFRKFARRNRALLTAACTLLMAIIIGLTASTVLIAQAAEKERQAAAQAMRERVRAEENFKRALEAMERIVERVSTELRDVPNTFQIRQALLHDALEFYKTLPEVQGIPEESQLDPALRHQTALAYVRVHSIAESLGHIDQSEDASRQAIKIFEALSREYPGTPQYREDLAGSYLDLGYTFLMSGRKEEELAIKQKALAIRQGLVADHPTVRSYQRQLADAHANIAHALSNLGRLEEAEEHHRQALEIRDRFPSQFPAPNQDRLDRANSLHWLGASLARRGKLDEAEQCFRQSLELREQIAAERPNGRGAQSNLAHIKAYLGNLLLQQGKLDEAEALCAAAVTIRERLVSRAPNSYEQSRRLSIELRGLAGVLKAMGRIEESEAAYRRTLAITEQRGADFPSDTQYTATWLASTHYRLGNLFHANGRIDDAADQFRQSLAAFELCLSKAPGTMQIQYQLADFLVNCPAVQFRDAERAMRLIKDVLQRAPGSHNDWSTMGIAQYRMGDAAGAIQSLTKSKDLYAGPDAELWLFLAMAHWNAGHEQEARKWYEQADAWINEHQPKDPRLGMFREEAQQALGIATEAKAAPDKSPDTPQPGSAGPSPDQSPSTIED